MRPHLPLGQTPGADYIDFTQAPSEPGRFANPAKLRLRLKQAVQGNSLMHAAADATHPSWLVNRPEVPLAAARSRPAEMIFTGRDEWQAGLRQHLLPLECVPVDGHAFRNNAVVAQMCGNPVAELRVDASRLIHRDRDLGNGASGSVKVMWQLVGRSRIRQGVHSGTLDAGTWTLCDARREYHVDFEQSARCLLILVPRSQCCSWLPALDALTARTLSASGPIHVARTILTSLLREGTEFDGRSERALHDSVVALVAHALEVELARRGLSVQPKRSVDFAQIQAYILDHLGDSALTIERVAAAFGMSRRNLYNVFAPVGVTPHSFIHGAKLDRARALLSDPGWHKAPIARIAEQCGFSDAAHFSRAFHAHHGAAPNAWRSRPD
jgi:AraC family transcriptional regulator, positive regulator of tynA and feaB